MAAPRLIVGLGNPGAEHEDTRHNAGFWLCERLAARHGVDLRRESRFHGIAGRTREQVWLLLPQTFMNRSGQAVAALARFYRILPAEMPSQTVPAACWCLCRLAGYNLHWPAR